MRFSLRKKLHTARGMIILEADLQVEDRELLVVTGPSGAGKTTLLRMLAGLLRPESGRIEVAGDTWLDTDRGIFLPSQARRVGMVFQDYALFPNMLVRENLDYARQPDTDPTLVEELMTIMEIEELAGRYPATLSGGQQQRVAVARALVRQPRLLLLDEPLSALDPTLRSKLQDYILRVHRRYGLTTLMVTHDLREISKMAQRVVRLERGKLIDQGPPQAELDGIFLAEVHRLERTEGGYLIHLIASGATLAIALPEGCAGHYRPGRRVRVGFQDGALTLLGPAET